METLPLFDLAGRGWNADEHWISAFFEHNWFTWRCCCGATSGQMEWAAGMTAVRIGEQTHGGRWVGEQPPAVPRGATV